MSRAHMKKRLAFGFPIVLVASAVLIGVMSQAAPQGKPAETEDARHQGVLKGKNLILITLDTTRADHITCYGGPQGLTPNIDALAADGTLFLKAYSQTNVTNPSHTAILTGLRAIDSRIFNNQTTFTWVSPDADTLGLAFQRAGYRTAGFPATPHLSNEPECLGMTGFDHYPNVPKGGGFDARQIVDNTIEWIKSESDKPFFAWVHFFDPHMKYWPPEEYRNQFYPKDKDPTSGDGPPLEQNDDFKRSPEIVTDQFGKVRDLTYPPALYQGEVRYTDEEVGRLIKFLKGAGLYENTGIVLVADHGESLGDHNVYYDHYGLFEASMHIPCLMRFPGLPGGNKVTDFVTHVDLAPTISHLYGLTFRQRLASMHGVNLTPTLFRETNSKLAVRPATVHEDAYNRQVMVRKGPWKLIQMIEGPKYEWADVLLFNVEEDPQEKTNLAESKPEVVADLSQYIKNWLKVGKVSLRNPKPDDPKDRAKQEEAIKNLVAIGYAEAGEGADEENAAAKPPPFAVNEYKDFLFKLDLKLTSDQKKRIEKVIDDAKTNLRKANAAKDAAEAKKIRTQMRLDVADVLTDEQNLKVNEAITLELLKRKDGE
ncbi:MAG: sulfatase [Phycisphaerae bacterium]|nr:sulfatase [Planctomycetia bacterium]MCK6465119.1 sulfatase-like hydrolase/transferase [Phycisphaerae bacterium]MCL4717250.1 sulfatase [Phycisphaerae bacterium]NUQ07943.1 sulfatase [Phycisphaerae bacterium]